MRHPHGGGVRGSVRAELLPLNRSEHMGLASEGYLGPLLMPYLVRFDGPVEIDVIRAAMRDLTTAFPRLRGVVVPTLTRYALRILPDDELVDRLFEDAFRVRRDVDAGSRASLESFHDQVVNDPIPLERGLPFRAWFVPHARRPALMFCMHHLVGDGRTMLDILGALVERLGGKQVATRPLDPPTQLPGLLPPMLVLWPSSVLGYLRNLRRDARRARDGEVVTLATRTSPRFAQSAVRYHDLPLYVPKLQAAARRLRSTQNTLLVAAIANAILQRERENPRAVAAIRVSVDLRRYFPEHARPRCGNYVAAFEVRAEHQPDFASQVRSVDRQIRDHLDRFARRENALPFLCLDLLSLVGRRLYSLIFVTAKERGLVEQPTCHVSNIGHAEVADAAASKVKIDEVWPMAVSPVPMFALFTISGRTFLGVTYQRDEIDPSTIDDVLASIDAELRRLAPETGLDFHGAN